MSDELITRFLSFLSKSPTPWHAAATAAEQLEAAGYVPVDLGAAPSAMKPGFKGYVRRSGTIVAFRIGQKHPAEAGFRVVSAHTDSPNLRLKPQPAIRGNGYVRVGVEVYGGVLLATWTDRDLGLAGQVWVREGEGQKAVLVDLRRPLCRIPNLAIHLNRGVNDEGLKLNAQTQMPAVLTLDTDGGDKEDPVRKLLAEETGVDAKDVLAWDLCLYDITEPVRGGLDGEFVWSARLDNQGSCHAALEGLLASADGDSTAVAALFDHEEVGSTTSRGASSRLLESILDRVVRSASPSTGTTSDKPTSAEGGLVRAIEHSWHLSSDMAHAVHPGWSDKHDPQHMPMINKGPVIKQNASQRYGTEGETAALLVRLFERAEVPFQWFVNRSDLACGSTVGPLVAAQLGMRTVDVGNPMLSMHSAREMCGTTDQKGMVAVMASFLSGNG